MIGCTGFRQLVSAYVDGELVGDEKAALAHPAVPVVVPDAVRRGQKRMARRHDRDRRGRIADPPSP